MFKDFDVGRLIFIVPCLLFLVLIIVVKIKDIRFRKKGVIVKAKVKDVVRVENDDKTLLGYDTTFEFEYNGVKKEKTIFTYKKFKVGSTKEGIYLKGSRSNTLSVEGEGFFVANGAVILGVSFVLFVLFIVTYDMFNISIKCLIYVILGYFTFIFIFLFLIGKDKNSSKKNAKKNNKVNKVYYDKAYVDEYSSVSSNLVRYIPEYKYKEKTKKKKFSWNNIMFQGLFIGLGGISSVIGIIGTCVTIYYMFTFPYTVGEITEIYTYTVNTDDGVSNYVGVIYSYEVNEKEYTVDYKTGTSEKLYFNEVGDKVKIYYDENEPSDGFPKNIFAYAVVPLIIGLVFIYVGVSDIIEYRRNKKMYDAYIKMSEGEVK